MNVSNNSNQQTYHTNVSNIALQVPKKSNNNGDIEGRRSRGPTTIPSHRPGLDPQVGGSIWVPQPDTAHESMFLDAAKPMVPPFGSINFEGNE